VPSNAPPFLERFSPCFAIDSAPSDKVKDSFLFPGLIFLGPVFFFSTFHSNLALPFLPPFPYFRLRLPIADINPHFLNLSSGRMTP